MNKIIHYLKQHQLTLAVAESCTAGQVASTLVKQGKCGECLFLGYVVYSSDAKRKCLGVKKSTINKYTLTSEPVAKEMVLGLLKHQEINTAIATTGITGSKSLDGIPPGTICFSWGYRIEGKIISFSETQKFNGTNAENIKNAARYALEKLAGYHQKAKEINGK